MKGDVGMSSHDPEGPTECLWDVGMSSHEKGREQEDA